MNTLVPVSLVVVLLSYGVYQEARLKNMENQIHINTTENVRTQADIKEVKSNYVTIKEFTLTLENLNTKLDAIKKAVEK